MKPLYKLLADECRWPVARVNDEHLFCGELKAADCPYCEEHRKLAYRPDKREYTDRDIDRIAGKVRRGPKAEPDTAAIPVDGFMRAAASKARGRR